MYHKYSVLTVALMMAVTDVQVKCNHGHELILNVDIRLFSE